MAATPYAIDPHSASFALSFLLLFHLLFNQYQWLAIKSECQTEKMYNNETFLFMQNAEPTTQSN